MMCKHKNLNSQWYKASQSNVKGTLQLPILIQMEQY